MVTMSILLASCLVSSPDWDVHVTEPDECGSRFDKSTVPHSCVGAVGIVDVRIFEKDEQFCAEVGDAAVGGCFDTCESTLRVAAVEVGKVLDNTCDVLPKPMRPRAASSPSVASDDFPEIRLRTPFGTPAWGETTDMRTSLMIGMMHSFGHHGSPVASGFMTGVGVKSDGMQFALIAGMADITRTHWYWRGGLELCRGGRDGPVEWNGCLGIGGGEFYMDPRTRHEYGFVAASYSMLIHVNDALAVRLDGGFQVADAHRKFGLRIEGRSTFNPSVLVGIHYEIPVCRKNRGRSCA